MSKSKFKVGQRVKFTLMGEIAVIENEQIMVKAVVQDQVTKINATGLVVCYPDELKSVKVRS